MASHQTNFRAEDMISSAIPSGNGLTIPDVGGGGDTGVDVDVEVSLSQRQESEKPEKREKREKREASDESVPTGTINEVMTWVGDDPQRAQQALDVEREKESPRTSLVNKLEDVKEGDNE